QGIEEVDPIRRHHGCRAGCPGGDEHGDAACPRPRPGSRFGPRVGDPGDRRRRHRDPLDPRRDADSAQWLPSAEEAEGVRSGVGEKGGVGAVLSVSSYQWVLECGWVVATRTSSLITDNRSWGHRGWPD